MTQIMTPSQKPITDGQIDKAVEVYRSMLKKHRSELGSQAVQDVLCRDAYINEQIGVLRKYVEASSNLILVRTKVKRNRTPQQAIGATGRAQNVDKGVLDTMPQNEGEDVEVFFFPLKRDITCDELQSEYERRGLVPDPYAQAAVNENDPTFAAKHPNCSQWKDSKDNWCYCAFHQWTDDEREVDVDRDDEYWFAFWWGAGVRK